jgi:plastocyanin
MKQLLLMGAIATVVFVAVSVYLTRQNSAPIYNEPKAAPGMGITGAAEDGTDSYDIEIVFDGETFTPSELTIKKGQRIRFFNGSTIDIWPASGVHPTHTLYPEKESTDCLGSSFDACRNLAPGDFFDFTFNYVGEWRYHDHSHAYYTGSITVTE